MTVRTSRVRNCVAIYAGRTCLGHVISRRPGEFEAFDTDEKFVGVFETPAGAADALGVVYDLGGRHEHDHGGDHPPMSRPQNNDRA